MAQTGKDRMITKPVQRRDHLPASADSANSVTAPISFIVPQDEKPFYRGQALTGGEPEFAFSLEEHDVSIADCRPMADAFSLDSNGFALRHAPTAVADFYNDEAVRGAYFAEIEALLKAELGAARVEVFDVTRRADSASGAANRDGSRNPAFRAHVDYTEDSGPVRAREVLGAEDFDRYMAEGSRVLQVNVWRPIAGPVRRSPLAVADGSSVARSDLIATDQIFPDRVGELYHLAHNPAQRWYYAPEMNGDEVFLILGWDSAARASGPVAPHAAFALPDQDSAPTRESIEVRTFAVIE